MKQIALIAIWLAASNTLTGQGGSKTLVNDLVKHWQASKKLSLAVAEAAPADAYRPFKSSSSEWNFADEMGSLALANVLSCSSALHTGPGEISVCVRSTHGPFEDGNGGELESSVRLLHRWTGNHGRRKPLGNGGLRGPSGNEARPLL
jgi:hypothetical protein